jgi:hypothetical protein
LPDFSELLPPQIPAGKRELDAREDVAVRSNVTSGVAGAARQPVHNVLTRCRRRCTELFHVADKLLTTENLL